MKKKLILNVIYNDHKIEAITSYDSYIIFYQKFYDRFAYAIDATVVFGNSLVKLNQPGLFLYYGRIKTYDTIKPADFEDIAHSRSIYIGAPKSGAMQMYTQTLVVVKENQTYEMGGELIINKEIARHTPTDWGQNDIVDDGEVGYLRRERNWTNDKTFNTPLYQTVAKYVNKAIEINLRDMNKDLYCEVDEREYSINFPGLTLQSALALFAKKEVAFQWVHKLIINTAQCIFNEDYKVEFFIIGSATAAVNYTKLSGFTEFEEVLQTMFNKMESWLHCFAFNLYHPQTGLLVADVKFTLDFDYRENSTPVKLPVYNWRSFAQPISCVEDVMQKLAVAVKGKVVE